MVKMITFLFVTIFSIQTLAAHGNVFCGEKKGTVKESYLIDDGEITVWLAKEGDQSLQKWAEEIIDTLDPSASGEQGLSNGFFYCVEIDGSDLGQEVKHAWRVEDPTTAICSIKSYAYQTPDQNVWLDKKLYHGQTMTIKGVHISGKTGLTVTVDITLQYTRKDGMGFVRAMDNAQEVGSLFGPGWVGAGSKSTHLSFKTPLMNDVFIKYVCNRQ